MSDRFMCNVTCPWFPCHKDVPEDTFNCLFCYCPLYSYQNCGGQYTMLKNGWKDCSACTFPHENANADDLVSRLVQLYESTVRHNKI